MADSRLAPQGKGFPQKLDTPDLPLCNFEVFCPAFSMARQGQTSREAGTQSHGPLWGSRATERRRSESNVSEGQQPESLHLERGRVAWRTASPSTRSAPPRRGGAATLLCAVVVPQRTPTWTHGQKHIDPGQPEAACGRAGPRFETRVGFPELPAFAPSRTGHGEGAVRSPLRPGTTDGKESEPSRRAHTCGSAGTPSSLWGRAPSAQGGDAYRLDPWGQILQVRLSTCELSRAH
jgi:hypothetical protein